MTSSIKAIAAVALLSLSSLGWAASSNWVIDIANDRVEAVRSELAMGANPNAVNPKGQPALMQAIQDGAWKVYDLLLRHRKIDINITNSHDETPLMYLAVVGQTARAAELIKRGAQVNRLGWTPLHYAASKGNLEMVKLLLAHKAIVNAPSPDGTSPLMMAAYAGNEAVVRTLLAAGADVTARNLQGDDAAAWARRMRDESLAAKLDALTQKALKQRAAARAAGSQAAGASAASAATDGTSSQGTGFVQTVNTEPSVSLPDTVQKAATKGAQGADLTTPSDSGSGSRYFDLERFDRDEKLF